jgi:hypothetical protein
MCQLPVKIPHRGVEATFKSNDQHSERANAISRHGIAPRSQGWPGEAAAIFWTRETGGPLKTANSAGFRFTETSENGVVVIRGSVQWIALVVVLGILGICGRGG